MRAKQRALNQGVTLRQTRLVAGEFRPCGARAFVLMHYSAIARCDLLFPTTGASLIGYRAKRNLWTFSRCGAETRRTHRVSPVNSSYSAIM